MSDLAALDRAGAPVPEYKRAGTLIHVFAGIAAFALIGMLADVWQMVFLAVPLFAVAMMLMGSLRANGTWDRASSIGIVAYCAVLAVLVVWSILTASGDATLWGLPMSMGVIVYFIWPYTAIGAGLLYAFVFDRTIDEKRLAAVAD
ncbi:MULTISPECIES: hypothetical protein [Dietzia]|uniref:Uncharacterized protein n=1 Tax=Dietzia cinnamea TaxID=321318 RepID=A0A4R3ZW64_9ACTN|nr:MULTISPECIES: hypothetical protein [Dietzia]PWD95423.1 hypothetical protein DEQ16_10805 [Dietzia maris]MBM7231330.1 hypothetical protein [Dietzia cinnamea]MCT1713393.1 hypothetical protein [Dietzia cinnamea]MCT1864397.1 hypothetical protein [Dietzia cinnamea]MCT2029549.1 hypothetical protein [Dietzia cinnamea]